MRPPQSVSLQVLISQTLAFVLFLTNIYLVPNGTWIKFYINFMTPKSIIHIGLDSTRKKLLLKKRSLLKGLGYNFFGSVQSWDK